MDIPEKHGSYRELLFDKRWLEKRAKIIARDNYRCAICGSENDLVVHHKQYHVNERGERLQPWQYEDKYLITLCKSCHQRGHDKYEIPIKKVRNYESI